MTTFEFTHKNTSRMAVIDAKTEDEAWEELAEEVKSIHGYRLTDVVPFDDDEEEE